MQLAYLKVDRVQHSIGQGSFHSCRAFVSGHHLDYIVDCGGSNMEHRRQILDDFVWRRPKHFDWLVISHLDKDHIDGVPQLEERGVTFSQVFLPHVDVPTYMRWMLTRAAVLDGEELVEQLQSVATVGQLYSGSFGTPIMVTGAAPEPPVPDLPRLEPFRRPDRPVGPPTALRADDRQALGTAIAQRSLSCNYSLELDELDWVFRFFSKEWECPDRLDEIWSLPELLDLRAAMNDLAQLSVKKGQSFTEGVSRELKRTLTRTEANQVVGELFPEVKNAFRTSKVSLKTLLAKLYSLSPEIHDYNCASLCMYSGPSRRSSAAMEWYSRSLYIARTETAGLRSEAVRAAGWLGLGDVHFKSQDDLDEFLNHYRGELHYVATLVLAHHGSRHNYDDERTTLVGLLEGLPRSSSLAMIAAADPAHRFGHPHSAVLAVCARFGTTFIVDRTRESVIEESVESGSKSCPFCC